MADEKLAIPKQLKPCYICFKRFYHEDPKRKFCQSCRITFGIVIIPKNKKD